MFTHLDLTPNSTFSSIKTQKLAVIVALFVEKALSSVPAFVSE